MSTSTSPTANENNVKGQKQGMGSKIKGAWNVVHGFGETVRGQLMGAVDDSPANREIANKGRLETKKGMDTFHKKPVSTNNTAVGNQPSTQTEQDTLPQSENISTQHQQPQQEQQRLEPQRVNATTNPPHTFDGSPVANRDELPPAKTDRAQQSPLLGPEIPATHHVSDAYEPHPAATGHSAQMQEQHFRAGTGGNLNQAEENANAPGVGAGIGPGTGGRGSGSSS